MVGDYAMTDPSVMKRNGPGAEVDCIFSLGYIRMELSLLRRALVRTLLGRIKSPRVGVRNENVEPHLEPYLEFQQKPEERRKP